MEEDPFGRMMGMGEPWMRGRECFLRKEEEITLPSAPQSIKIRAGAPATLPINERRVREACSAVKACRRTDFCRKRLVLRLDWRRSRAVIEESGSRSTSSDKLRPTDEVSDTSSSSSGSSSEGTVVVSVLGTVIAVGEVCEVVGGNGWEEGNCRGAGGSWKGVEGVCSVAGFLFRLVQLNSGKETLPLSRGEREETSTIKSWTKPDRPRHFPTHRGSPQLLGENDVCCCFHTWDNRVQSGLAVGNVGTHRWS